MTAENPTLAAEANIFATNPDGFKVHFKLIAESPNKAIEGINALGGWLKQHGYSPDASMGATSAPAQGSGEAVWIKGEGGRPPKCSLHGAGKWMEGTSKSTGKPYAFWSCTSRDCRPKGEAA